ncbi:Nucleotide-binding universal stress protein, UspA family [Desulfonispora thiosulfatigenes DSM 11270]|uniref:Nucleotide-binding universal stress protein, UspA family n=1 Tax=Desulfonispora thiosulfatigenes DSM 11270 TaxID=656914 RepID=A0A1W1UKP9_DESTI|nr:universal stress protein [Desulfonispora thiosulfatigenes]SMB81302.1 Nucleotide-binding universal stress protein, UspA family [Desulfonispora thiosulfatigenes DSM 11270]SMB81371.1 Nucleotide-binding universal stress protein, UspA family [Desulfonispora thiosulfatigenes DSM 11270]
MYKILLPIDSGGLCALHLESVKNIASKFKAEILLLHVIEYDFNSYTVSLEAGAVPNDDFDKAYQEFIDVPKEFLTDNGIKVDVIIELGKPANIILDRCEKENCDMIMMCTHGMSLPKRFLLGSVTNKVVHHAKVPVLVLR